MQYSLLSLLRHFCSRCHTHSFKAVAFVCIIAVSSVKGLPHVSKTTLSWLHWPSKYLLTFMIDWQESAYCSLILLTSWVTPDKKTWCSMPTHSNKMHIILSRWPAKTQCQTTKASRKSKALLSCRLDHAHTCCNFKSQCPFMGVGPWPRQG